MGRRQRIVIKQMVFYFFFSPGKFSESSKRQGNSWYMKMSIMMERSVKLPERGKEGTKSVRNIGKFVGLMNRRS